MYLAGVKVGSDYRPKFRVFTEKAGGVPERALGAAWGLTVQHRKALPTSPTSPMVLDHQRLYNTTWKVIREIWGAQKVLFFEINRLWKRP